MSCNNCNSICCCQNQGGGSQGPVGPQGPQGPTGPEGPAGADGNGVPLENFYEELISQLEVVATVDPAQPWAPTAFHYPPGYEILEFENTSGAAKNYLVQGGCEAWVNTPNVNDLENGFDMGIVRIIGGVNQPADYETYVQFDLRGSLFNGVNIGDEINLITADNAYDSSDGGTTFTNPIEFRFGSGDIRQTPHIIKKVLLNPGEKVGLMFKTKDASAPSTLRKAQFFVQELSN